MIFVVAAVVAAASLVARYDDTHIAAPPSPDRPSAAPGGPARSDRIDFVTSGGAGELILVDRVWSDGGRFPPDNGTYLQIEVELVCTSGQVDYDPFNFQVFDASGTLFETDTAGVDDPLLDAGVLLAGESVHGSIAFDMPRGDATLLMSDGTDQTITALKVPD